MPRYWRVKGQSLAPLTMPPCMSITANRYCAQSRTEKGLVTANAMKPTAKARTTMAAPRIPRTASETVRQAMVGTTTTSKPAITGMPTDTSAENLDDTLSPTPRPASTTPSPRRPSRNINTLPRQAKTKNVVAAGSNAKKWLSLTGCMAKAYQPAATRPVPAPYT